MFRLVRLAVPIWSILLVSIGIVTAIAHQQTPVLAFLHLDHCQLPCWVGVIPGKTTIGELKALVAKYYSSKGYKAVARDISVEIHDDLTGKMLFRVVPLVPKLTLTDDDIVQSLELQFWETIGDVRLGDVFVAFDRPDQMVTWGMGGGSFPSLTYERHNIVVATAKGVAERQERQLPICIQFQDDVSFIAVFADPLPDDYWMYSNPQTWSHFGNCFN